MGSMPSDGRFENPHRGHGFPFAHAKGPARGARRNVQAKAADDVAGGAPFDEVGCAAGGNFLGMLENKPNGNRKLLHPVFEEFHRAEQHRSVAIVTAEVSDAVHL